ncbi:uncharacterized [Tachysurus ichikawai]
MADVTIRDVSRRKGHDQMIKRLIDKQLHSGFSTDSVGSLLSKDSVKHALVRAATLDSFQESPEDGELQTGRSSLPSCLPALFTRLPHTRLLTLHSVPFFQLFLSALERPPWTPARLSGAMCVCPGKAEGFAGISVLIPAITHPEGVITARPIRRRSQANEGCCSSGSGQFPYERQ